MAAGGATPLGNLPVELTSFVGRTQELPEIRRLLAVAHAVTLTGPGGIGKTRLALRAARELAPHFAHGVWLVELAEVDNPEVVVQAVARVLGVHEQPGATTHEAVVAHLLERQLLIVLDNCEHLIDACRDLVAAIVSRDRDVRVLATSRQRLGLVGESLISVPPLELQAEQEHTSSGVVPTSDAVTLLVDRSRALVPEFTLTDETRDAVVEICRRLDGMPLAIELAAVRLASLTPTDLLDRLDDRFRLLTAARDQRSRRHQALRAAVEWSHELLGPEERMLWRRLSVFAGSVGIDGAEAVCAGDGLERDRVLDLIASLVDSSVLTVVHGAHRTRYRLLDTMRLYGAERLREAGEELELRRRHALWYASLVSADERPWWMSPGQPDAVDVLDVEWANIEAALDFVSGSAEGAPIGLRMATDLTVYWIMRGSYRTGGARLDALLDAAPALTAERAFALWARGFMAQAIGDSDTSLESYEAARQLSEQIGAKRQLGYALMGLALVRLRRGELDPGSEALLASDDLTREHPVDRGFNRLLTATLLAVVGEWARAAGAVREGLDATAALGDSFVRGSLLVVAGTIEWQLGDTSAAVANINDAVRIGDRLGWRGALNQALDARAWIAASMGELERAAMLEGAVTSLRQDLGTVGLPWWQPQRDRAAAQIREGLDEPRARECYEHGYALAREHAAARLALDEVLPPARPTSAAERDPLALTERELEVARLVADGRSNPAIAEALYVSTATVKTHVSHILQKLALESRVQLASWIAAHDPEPADR
jgi:non-specific serine/threonine protein kinase